MSIFQEFIQLLLSSENQDAKEPRCTGGVPPLTLQTHKEIWNQLDETPHIFSQTNILDTLSQQRFLENPNVKWSVFVWFFMKEN